MYLPTMYDLPSENPEAPDMPDQFHTWQSELLTQTFVTPCYPENQMLIASDLYLYYDPANVKFYKRPNWFVVLNVPHLYKNQDERYSYVFWDEKEIPFLVVELLSQSTKKEDLGMSVRKAEQIPTKWEVYETILGVPYYAIYSRSEKLRIFKLINHKYREIFLTKQFYWFPEIELYLGLWNGTYNARKRTWLRWYDREHHLIPTHAECAAAEKKRADELALIIQKMGINLQDVK